MDPAFLILPAFLLFAIHRLRRSEVRALTRRAIVVDQAQKLLDAPQRGLGFVQGRASGHDVRFEVDRGFSLRVPTEGVRLVATNAEVIGAPADVVAEIGRRVVFTLPSYRTVRIDDRGVHVDQPVWRSNDVEWALALGVRVAGALREALASDKDVRTGGPYRPQIDAAALATRDERRRHEIRSFASRQRVIQLAEAALIIGAAVALALLCARLFL